MGKIIVIIIIIKEKKGIKLIDLEININFL